MRLSIQARCVRLKAMPTYILLYNGPPAPPDATHAGWREWFQSLGHKLVDVGSPMREGFVVGSDAATSDAPTSLRGYGIIRAEDREEVRDLLRTHPLFAAGPEYVIEVFEVPAK
jgi:hypothetical protein